MATRVGSKSICGFLTLLQAWIYEYFPLIRPSQILQAPDDPRASSWVCHRFAGGDDARKRLVRYRQMLDDMSGEDVSWTPYGRDAGTEVLRYLYTGVIRFADLAEVMILHGVATVWVPTDYPPYDDGSQGCVPPNFLQHLHRFLGG
ncbi:unnamed protein product [Linum tenue]|uniref:Aminotransferase-like plant mobile domain-containing protein n=1 Tax=Linum tenue TaxID=586396 RepID=A0AAV0LE50_9ROSI|nr:unnamed protein product [Linum tenue]